LNAPLIAVFAGSSFAHAWAVRGQRGRQAAAAPAIAFVVVLLVFLQLRILDAFKSRGVSPVLFAAPASGCAHQGANVVLSPPQRTRAAASCA
jgi:isopentenyl phosphate kinase